MPDLASLLLPEERDKYARLIASVNEGDCYEKMGITKDLKYKLEFWTGEDVRVTKQDVFKAGETFTLTPELTKHAVKVINQMRGYEKEAPLSEDEILKMAKEGAFEERKDA